jgi:hypothetical protein
VKSRTTLVKVAPRASGFTLADVDEYLTNSRSFNAEGAEGLATVKVL